MKPFHFQLHFLPNFSANISPCTSASFCLYSWVPSAPRYTLAFPLTHPQLAKLSAVSFSALASLPTPPPPPLFLHYALLNAFSPDHSVFSALSFVAPTPATKAPSPFLLPSISLELISFLYSSLFSFFSWCFPDFLFHFLFTSPAHIPLLPSPWPPFTDLLPSHLSVSLSFSVSSS